MALSGLWLVAGCWSGIDVSAVEGDAGRDLHDEPGRVDAGQDGVDAAPQRDAAQATPSVDGGASMRADAGTIADPDAGRASTGDPAVDIVGLRIIDDADGTDRGPLEDGRIVDLELFPERTFRIRAITSPPTVGSVFLGLDGTDIERVDDGQPYELFLGEDEAVDIALAKSAACDLEITATPFSGPGATGHEGPSLTARFGILWTITDSVSIDGFVLVDAVTGADIQRLTEGETLSLASLPATGTNIRVETTPAEIARVFLETSDEGRNNELAAPYYVYGNVDATPFAHFFEAGAYSLSAEAFGSICGRGALDAASLNLTFVP